MTTIVSELLDSELKTESSTTPQYSAISEPRAADYKGATSADAMDKAASRRFSPNLPESVAAGIGGQLSPAWAEWLMGWPPGWASLDPLSNVEEWINETATGEWWKHEHDLPRIAKGIPSRAKRLMAIGNGQVPAVVAAAWKLLTQDLEAGE